MLIPYSQKTNKKKGWIFLVWLSHKLGKNWSVLEAFDSSTVSWKLINNAIKTFNNPDKIFKTNLVKWVPVDGNWKLRYPNQKEKEAWLKLLIADMQIFQPRTVILFWRQVADFALDKLKSIFWESVQIVSMEHPSYIATYKKKEVENYEMKIKEIIEWDGSENGFNKRL